jgi:NAD-dependent deacetylase
MKPEVQANKIVIFSGAGVSAESGLKTFRDSGGLWNEYSWQEIASPEGWKKQPEVLLDFYNRRRHEAWLAEPNAAHVALASLEALWDVVVITQNVDELHERAGSSNVIHLHGRLSFARSSATPHRRYRIDDAPIVMGQLCEEGSQLRPDVVWFGEDVENLDQAQHHIATAAKVLVIGTSLSVFPAAALVKRARGRAEKVLVALDVDRVPYGFRFMQGKATEIVPGLVSKWIEEGGLRAEDRGPA